MSATSSPQKHVTSVDFINKFTKNYDVGSSSSAAVGPSTSTYSTNSTSTTNYYYNPNNSSATSKIIQEYFRGNGGNMMAFAKSLSMYSPYLSDEYVKDYLRKSILRETKKLKFRRLVYFFLKREQKLVSVFQRLDHDADGKINGKQMLECLDALGSPLAQCDDLFTDERLLGKVEGTIDVNRFMEFFFYFPTRKSILSIPEFVRTLHDAIDIGDDTQIPEDFSAFELQSGIWWRHLVAGGVAGGVSRTMTAPLDRLKVFMQVHASSKNDLKVRSGLGVLLKEGGLFGLWRGNGVNVIKIAPESAIKFMSYEQLKRMIYANKDSSGGELTNGERFIAGSGAGCIAQTFVYPLEVLKTRLALRKSGSKPGAFSAAVRYIYFREGPRGFYRGFVPNLLGIIPYAGIDLAVYEWLKRKYCSVAEKEEPGVLALLFCGGMSSSCGMFTAYPLSLIRTRLQAHGLHLTSPPHSVKSNQLGLLDVSVEGGNKAISQIRHIMENEGIKGFYRGIIPNFMKVIPAVGISYVVYEKLRQQLGVQMT